MTAVIQTAKAVVSEKELNVRFNVYRGLRSSAAIAPLGSIRASPVASSSSRSGWIVRSVSTPDVAVAKRSSVELFKEQSNFLRFPLKEELQTEAPNINEASTQLIKFHGSYQQTDRDQRGTKAYQFMLRTKNPCGKVPNKLYLVMDDLADEFGIGTLRLTTRQTFQLHGVLKKNLKTVISSIIKNMGSTLGACGDLNRNVLAPAAPYIKKDYIFSQQTAEKIASLLTPQSGSYYDIWVDGDKVMSAEPPDVVAARNDNSYGTNFLNSPEPIYGSQFLPRKFKVAVTVPTDNSVDILTNDVGIVVVSDSDGEPQGFNIYVGGGMGRTHRVETTFPRLGEPLGYVPKEDILYAVKAIVVTQRENGRRDDRKYSRMKYLINEWGIEKFRSVVEQYYGKKFEAFKELPEWEFESYLGWHEQGDGALFCGVHVDSGRIGGEMKKALREVIQRYNLNVRITPNQNLILCDIHQSWKQPIAAALVQAGLQEPSYVDPLNITAMACPALPLCALAITEAERGVPDILKRARAVLDKVGIQRNESVVIRVTGCPNGCARPYMAELGLVGVGPNSYQIWLGGTPNQTSLARCFMNKVKIQDLERVLEPLFYCWRSKRLPEESFGQFVNRIVCHGHGVMHRDLKPENFLFANKKETAPLKAIDFGLSVDFKPGERFSEIVGSPYYMAPDVLKRNYGPEIDVWSAGVILYILLCGVPPFWAETEQGVAHAIIRSVIDFNRDPWPKISDTAKDLVKKMLNPDPKRRLTAQEVLDHPWLQNAKKAPNVNLGETVRARLQQFTVMNKLKKKALRVVAEHLSVEEVADIKAMFYKMDADNNGKISFEELKSGLHRLGHQMPDADVKILMDAADVDGDGALEFGEFVAMSMSINIKKLENDEHLHKAFAYFDQNKSGYIEIEELGDSLQDDLGPNHEEIINAIIRDVDTDKDGKISYEEFAAMMKAGTDWRKASRQYSRERFTSLSLRLMKDGSLQQMSK